MLKNEEGSLAITLIFITVLVTMGLSLSARAIFNLETTTAKENDTKAFYLAEAGIEDFLNEVNSTEEDENITINSIHGNKVGSFNGSYNIEVNDTNSDDVNRIRKKDFIDNLKDYTIISTGEVNNIEKEIEMTFAFNSSAGSVVNRPDRFNGAWGDGNQIQDNDDIKKLDLLPYEIETVPDIDPNAIANKYDKEQYHIGDPTAEDVLLEERYYYTNESLDLKNVNSLKGIGDKATIIFVDHNIKLEGAIEFENIYLFMLDGNFGLESDDLEVTATDTLFYNEGNFNIEGKSFDFEGYIVSARGYVNFALTEDSDIRLPQESLDLPNDEVFGNDNEGNPITMKDFGSIITNNKNLGSTSRFEVDSYEIN